MYADRPPFVVYLVQSNALVPDELVKVLDIQYRQRQPFGRIALQTRKLNVRQTSEILSYQATHPDVRFGEIAVKLGYMTEADVAEVLAIQRTAMLPVEEILVAQGLLSREEVESHKRRYEATYQFAA